MAREDGISRIEDEIENLVYGGKVKQNERNGDCEFESAATGERPPHQ